MLKIEYHAQFKRDYKQAIRRGLDPELFSEVISILVSQQPLPEKYRDHPLYDSKHYRGMRECHIQPDWLLIYRIDNDRLTLILTRTGTHSDLF